MRRLACLLSVPCAFPSDDRIHPLRRGGFYPQISGCEVRSSIRVSSSPEFDMIQVSSAPVAGDFSNISAAWRGGR
ncbi:hypothetical protein, partial [Actinophytocola sp.]|uniref:hypothetical protein n=1 Tax=Actinophytocola sp. TaxID=1872138 RepID=UPI00389B0EA5